MVPIQWYQVPLVDNCLFEVPGTLYILDSRIRRGSDIIKAIAFGAKAMLIGRPCMYGLAIAGAVGVKAILQNMIADMDITLGIGRVKSD